MSHAQQWPHIVSAVRVLNCTEECRLVFTLDSSVLPLARAQSTPAEWRQLVTFDVVYVGVVASLSLRTNCMANKLSTRTQWHTIEHLHLCLTFIILVALVGVLPHCATSSPVYTSFDRLSKLRVRQCTMPIESVRQFRIVPSCGSRHFDCALQHFPVTAFGPLPYQQPNLFAVFVPD